MITENLSTLKIHKLTQAQYDRELAAGNLDENALYLTPDKAVDLSDYAKKSELPTKVSQLQNDTGYLTEHQDISGKADKSQGVFYIEGDGSSTTDTTNKVATWIGSHDEIAEYFNGLTILYKVVTAGSTTTTLNINNLGAVTVVRNATTGISTSCPVNGVLLLTYTVDSDGTAYWKTSDYDANTKNTAGTSNKTGTKLFLVGGASQSSSGVTTYSNSSVYVGTDNCLYSNGEKVATSTEVNNTVSTAVTTHNSATDSHADIRKDISDLSVEIASLPNNETLINNVTTRVPLVKVAEQPEFVENISECTDTSKVYILPNGHLCAYTSVNVPTEGETVPNFTNLFDTSKGAEIHNGMRYSASSAAFKDSSGNCSIKIPLGREWKHNQQFVLRVRKATISSATYADNVYGLIGNGSSYTGGSLYSTATMEGSIVQSGEDVVFTITMNKNDSTSTFNTVIFNVAQDSVTDVDNLIVTFNEEISYTVTEGGTEVVVQWTDTGIEFNQPPDYAERIALIESRIEANANNISSILNRLSAIEEKLNNMSG